MVPHLLPTPSPPLPSSSLQYSLKIAFVAQINKTMVITARGAIRVDAWEIKGIEHRSEGCSKQILSAPLDQVSGVRSIHSRAAFHVRAHAAAIKSTFLNTLDAHHYRCSSCVFMR